MPTSDTFVEFPKAFAVAQSEMENAVRDISGYNYKYADLAQILKIVRPVLSKYGLSVIQTPSVADGQVSVTTRIMHSSGEWIEEALCMPLEPTTNGSQAQAVGTVITYARRYALAAMCGIAQEDNDAAIQPRETSENAADPAPQPLIDEFEKIASKGTQALESAWKALDKTQRRSLGSGFIAQMKDKAKASD